MNPHVTEFNTLYDAIIKKKRFLKQENIWIFTPITDPGSTSSYIICGGVMKVNTRPFWFINISPCLLG